MKVTPLRNKLDKGFYKSEKFANIVRIGAAAFEPRMTGGFAKRINAMQGSWPSLNDAYLAHKRKKGQDQRKWVRTGRTLAALSMGRFPKETVRKGVRYKITPGRLMAILSLRTFKPDNGKKPSTTVQKKIFKNAHYGIDTGKGVVGGVRGKRGQNLSGFPARPLFRWWADEIPEIEQSIAAETLRILEESFRGNT